MNKLRARSVWGWGRDGRVRGQDKVIEDVRLCHTHGECGVSVFSKVRFAEVKVGHYRNWPV